VFVSSILAIAWSRSPIMFDERAAFPGSDRRLPYSRWKRAAEAACLEAWRADGQPIVIVNPGEIYGPDDTDRITAGNLLDFARSNPVLVSRGGTLVAAREDVAAGIVAALEVGRPGERYILGGENLSIRELAATFLDLFGDASRRIIELPNPLLSGLGAVGRALPIPLPFNPHVIPYATRFWWMDSSKAQRELGVSFRSGRDSLRPALDWLRETGALRTA
jgi:dihydroflavonol-4-reductase